tara:strand:+ start:1328 stop:2221 length:894 start_codon:yes stop_codon:yes gene_type:complete
MSYYDRLQKVIGEEEGGTGKVQDAIAMAKSRSEDAFSQTQAAASSIMPEEINKFGEEFGIKMAGKFVLKKAGMPLLQKAVASQRATIDAGKEEAEGQISDLGEESAAIFAKGVTRMSRLGTDVTVRAEAGQAADAGAGAGAGAGTGTGAVGGDVQLQTMRSTAIEGKRLTSDPEGEYGTEETSGLTQSEVARVADINETTSGLADTVAEAGARTVGEVALDALPVIGEIAMLGGMFGGMIHAAHHAHVTQMADDETERGDLQNVQAAQMYSGFNRPSFGSMALPSFDTSKNPAMLQE